MSLHTASSSPHRHMCHPLQDPQRGQGTPHSYDPLLRRPKKYSTYTRSEDELAMCITIPGHKSCSRNRKHCINCDWTPVKRSSKLIGNAAGSIDGINPSLAKSHNRVPANSSRRQCRYRCNVRRASPWFNCNRLVS